MHASLAELLENLKPGLLWVTRDSIVRYANGEATARTGLAPGRKLYDPDLVDAVMRSVVGRVPRNVTAVGVLGNGDDQLKCRVIPGLAQDDAFVLIGRLPGDDDGAGFDNLMQVVKSDLRDPLRQSHAALQLMREGEAPGAELRALIDGVGELIGVLDKLVDLASLWGSGTLLANDRIEFWPLLQQAWAEVEPLALDRSVKVRFDAGNGADHLAALYGSERWLRRVFVECLDAAVRATQRGGLLEIEHRQMGARAVIVFRDCGVFAAHNTAAVGTPLSTGRAPGARNRGGAATRAAGRPQSAREQLGLRLCRHIVALHGGELREEKEDGQRHFLIELPTGAPHREEHAQLDIAQAQRYASDLSALMTRARQRGARAQATPAPTPDADAAPAAGPARTA